MNSWDKRGLYINNRPVLFMPKYLLVGDTIVKRELKGVILVYGFGECDFQPLEDVVPTYTPQESQETNNGRGKTAAGERLIRAPGLAEWAIE